MSDTSFNTISIALSAGTFLVTVIGLYAVYIQIKKINQAAWSNTHSMLCDQSFELLRFLSENIVSYDYFYNRKPLQDDSADRITILYMAEALANFLEHLILQKDNLPAKQWEVWERFIKTTFKNSVVITEFIRSNREWYSPDLSSVADECKLLFHGLN